MNIRSGPAAVAWVCALALAGWSGWRGADEVLRARLIPLPSEPFGIAAAAGMVAMTHALLSLRFRRKR